jgi:CRISPR/Cas system CSM-associated protein Csm3 (group 7 of RAMP superfamily)
MITIDLTLTFETPLNIGSGAQRGTLADRAMIKDDRGWPYVPASALKGRLRHAVEQVAAGLGLRVCDTHRKMCREGDICAICRIFGAPWVPGRLRFERLTLSGPLELVDSLEAHTSKQRYPPTSHRYGVAISRRRGVAEENLLYTTELFEPGTALEFSGTLRGLDDLEPRDAALVVAGLRSLPAMGRGKGGGLGWITTTEVVVKENGKIWDDATLRAALTKEPEEADV